MNTNRLAGHELQAEGAPFRTGLGYKRPFRANIQGTGGMGFGLCSCGARSADVRSGNLRKAWHRDHKSEVRMALDEGSTK